MTQDQPVVDGLLILSDLALSHEDNKEVPMKQPHKPRFIQVSVTNNEGPVRGHAKALRQTP